ncbi:OmpA family protein [Xanthovirga aplysinae]|uniref:OmpA family protein n=1 Tax=Xanthovirga aplysinae TaxID=2529853 RepID=UPI0012BC6B43|nr:OmpA family protein [Xanthovirga aplysinae]MTI30938.1 hypothetical protein [Xanthovirga aplysinae]
MLRRYLALFFILFYYSVACQEVVAQADDERKAQKYVQLGDAILAETRAFSEARDMYVIAADLDPQNLEANFKAGDLFLQTVEKYRAAKYFINVFNMDPDYRFNLLFLIGESYQYGMEFGKAIDFYDQYLQKVEEKPEYGGRDKVEPLEVMKKIYECQNGIAFLANPYDLRIENLGRAVNSPGWDYAPVLNEEETIMIFTSRRAKGNLNENVDADNFPYEDIYLSKKVQGKWQSAKNIKAPVSSLYHESSVALSADGKQLYLYKDDDNGSVFVSELKGEENWSIPTILGKNINSVNYAVTSVAVSADNQLLFFASNKPGGNGGFDIYVSKQDEQGNWGPSDNLGPVINTEYDEESPFIDYDGKTLYFSSKGHQGMGGYDIFRSEYDSTAGEWTEPINLGYPINSPDDDIYFVSTKDGKRGYYSSVREDGMGYTDIYMVTIPQFKSELASKNGEKEDGEEQDKLLSSANSSDNEELEKVKVLIRVEDRDSSMPLDAKVTLTNEESRLSRIGKISDTGVYEFELLEKNDRPFFLSVESQNHIFTNVKLIIPAATTESQIVRRTIKLKPIDSGERFVLRNIYFDFDKAILKIESYNELNKLARLMAEHPQLKIEISGHTDDVGARTYNQKLSERRGRAVADFLLSRNIDPSRMIVVGYGMDRPLVSNDDEVGGRELNRRVEVKILTGV